MKFMKPATVAALAAAALLLTACSSGSTPVTTPSGTATPTPTSSAAAASGPVAPSTGAVIGAWVAPTAQSDAGRMQALEAYEKSLGRPLGVVQNYHPWNDPFPSDFDLSIVASSSTLLLSWAGTDTLDIAAGKYDALIRQRALAVKQLDKPILLRWRWEMDRPNLADEIHTPADYIAAWDHIRSIFTAEGATNVGWVWCPLATGFDSGQAQKYYPGDDEVDWLCADAYSPDPKVPFATVAGSFLTWAASHDKPIIFAEVGAASVGNERSVWLAGLAATIRAHPQVKAVLYFDSALKNKQKNWSLRSSPADLAKLRSIAETPYFKATLTAPNS